MRNAAQTAEEEPDEKAHRKCLVYRDVNLCDCEVPDCSPSSAEL